MNEKKLYRSRTNKVFTGLAGGIGDYVGIDATVVRVLLIISTFLTGGAVLLVYLITVLFVPKAPRE